MVTALLRVSFLSMIPIPFSILMEQMAAILDSAVVSGVKAKKDQNMAISIASDEQAKTTFLVVLFDGVLILSIICTCKVD